MIGGVLGMGRRLAESRMTETVSVGRYALTRSPGALESTMQLVELFYEGPARVKYPSASATTKNPAGQQLVETAITVSIPALTVGLPTGSLVRIKTSHADAALVGRMFRIDGPAQAGQTTAHRYPVTEES